MSIHVVALRDSLGDCVGPFFWLVRISRSLRCTFSHVFAQPLFGVLTKVYVLPHRCAHPFASSGQRGSIITIGIVFGRELDESNGVMCVAGRSSYEYTTVGHWLRCSYSRNLLGDSLFYNHRPRGALALVYSRESFGDTVVSKVNMALAIL